MALVQLGLHESLLSPMAESQTYYRALVFTAWSFLRKDFTVHVCSRNVS